MENTFVWILIIAGATTALLGVFLVASERELKKKRLEIEELLAKLSDTAAQSEAPPVDLVDPVDKNEISRLMAINDDLQNQVNTQTAKLELARRTIDELETAAPEGSNRQAELDALRAANTQMSAEIDALKGRLELSAARASESASQNEQWADHERRLRQEITDLNEKLEDSRHQIRELENSQQTIANSEAIEAAHAQERQSFESRIADLGKELAAAREKSQEYDSVRNQLAESEQIQRDLAEQNRRNGEEIAHWRLRAAEAAESRRRLAALTPVCDGLRAKYETLAQQSKEFQDDLLAFVGLITEPIKANVPDGGSMDAAANAENSSTPTDPGEAAPGIAAAADDTGPKSKRVLGVVALILLGALGLFTYHAWNSPTEEPSVTAANLYPPPSAISPKISANAAAAPSAAARESEAAPSRKPNTSPQASAALAQQRPAKASLNVSGAYEIIRPTRVYAAPAELSTLIAEIEPGTKVNVVNARDGWLEIRSKHGRPPGYIRTETAARVTGQK